ncbi:4Fe-4S dicluster domain-containing protein [Vallitalea okinawensis]|uniref:4Fe-4S dicluster domain-containing protein n=1 Tax=Vallitalea okinawensis TaxID=2078660 RepID=UPI000CFD00E8|nr:4Fe-4S dicluster domain-containing protein [Vallitalea okinawensis]
MRDSKLEIRHMERIKQYPDQIVNEHEYAVEQGFSYFNSESYRNNCQGTPAQGPRGNIKKDGIVSGLKTLKEMAPNIIGIMSGMKKNFSDAENYVKELESLGSVSPTGQDHMKNFPNNAIWNKIKDYAWENHQVVIGFTEVPSEYIFKGKALLFRYALVCIQEMNEDLINKAPKIEANYEVMRVYNTLGKATNDLANWLKKEFNIKCIASHPMGGIVDTTPLAEKAGLGRIGHSGLLITPQFGTRLRISTVFIDTPLFPFTDNHHHDWVQNFCDQCHQCERKCPAGAIYSDKKTYIKHASDVPDRIACIDREKCYPYFCKTGGCGVCIKVCPFSNSKIGYNKLKEKFTKAKTSK